MGAGAASREDAREERGEDDSRTLGVAPGCWRLEQPWQNHLGNLSKDPSLGIPIGSLHWLVVSWETPVCVLISCKPCPTGLEE